MVHSNATRAPLRVERRRPFAGFGGGFSQVAAAGDDGLLYRVAEVLPEVETVGDLDGVRGALAGAL